MATPLKVVGTLPQIIRNEEKLYEGDLVLYFRMLINNAQNLHNPYHNFRHTMHVLWLCCCACRFYKEVLSPREMRDILVAALFHDFDHPGLMGNDDLNVERAVRSFKKYVLGIDKNSINNIASIIKATEYPYTCRSEGLPLPCQIIRDADLGQCFSTAWIQQVIFGLAREWNKSVLETLKGQIGFLEKMSFCTSWGKEIFPPEDIAAKRAEVQDLIMLLD